MKTHEQAIYNTHNEKQQDGLSFVVKMSILNLVCLALFLEYVLRTRSGCAPYRIIVKKLNSLKHLVRTTVAESHN